MRRLTLIFALLASFAAAQNPNTSMFPGSVATDNDLLVASNRASATTSGSTTAGATTINVGSTAAFIVPTVVTFADNGEMAKCLTKTVSSFTSCTRGFDSVAGGIAATSHAQGVAIVGNATAYYINQHAAEIKALETAAAASISNPMSALGDTMYGGVSGAVTRLAGSVSATKKFLTQTGDGVNSAAPGWNTISAADVPTLNQSTSGNAATATAFDHTPTCTSCSSIKTITAIDSGGNLTPTAIRLAAADGSTTGLAGFAANDFDAAAGIISFDYTNAQKATGSVNGILLAADWTTFNGKQAAGNYITALTGNVTASGPGSVAATIVAMPTGVTDAGYIAFTAIAAPTTPGAGVGRAYVDSTSKNLAVKDDAGVVKHGVQTKASASHNFLTAVDDAGSVSAAQPAYADISGTPTLQYQTIQDEGSDLTQRAKLNFIGPITCADNSGASKTDCTVPNRQIVLTIGAGDIATTGTKACSVVRVAYTIIGAYLVANALPTGANLVVDVKKVAFSSYTGFASASSIVASAPPTITTGASNPRASDTTLTGWTTSISAGDVVCVAITTAPTGGATFAALTLEVQ